MATCYQFALSNPVPGQEDEFNRWYGTDHLIHGVLTPGILAGQRFQRVGGPWPSGKHDYLTIWEMDDPAYALAQLAKVRETDGGHVHCPAAYDVAARHRAERGAHRDGHE